MTGAGIARSAMGEDQSIKLHEEENEAAEVHMKECTLNFEFVLLPLFGFSPTLSTPS